MGDKHTQKPVYDSRGFAGTVDSKQTCREMRKRLGKKALLRYSGGKDSTAAFLYMREAGFEVIPYVVASLPNLVYFDKTMDYLEEKLETKILKFQAGEITDAIWGMLYQPVEDEPWISECKLWAYKLTHLGDLLAKEYGIDDWEASGYSMFETMNRYYIGKYRGVIEHRKDWHPCWDWKPTQIFEYLDRYDISLGLDYLMDKTSMDGLPIITTLTNMKDKFPAEYERWKLFFPFIEARLARNVFRQRREEREAANAQ